jgi:cytoskeletal protein CcmA (bactofilin family)
MWNKEQSLAQTTPASEITPNRPPEQWRSRGGGVIGETMRIKGTVFSGEELQLNGEVEGDLESHGTLTIGASGKAEAGIKAKEVIVGGTVRGNIEAETRIVLQKGANLVGDVKTAGIVIEDGAYFKGGIDIVQVQPLSHKATAGG